MFDTVLTRARVRIEDMNANRLTGLSPKPKPGLLLRAWRAFGSVVKDRCNPDRQSPPPSRALLNDVRIALRLGFYDEAYASLMSQQLGSTNNAECLNLIGLTYEMRGDWNLARKSYSKAMAADPAYAPAQQNMRRWYELYTFGRSHVPRALGDEQTALGTLIATRGRSMREKAHC
jgi:tetratricopeptide (TPR) repeat protein